jgi:hypothetical protein
MWYVKRHLLPSLVAQGIDPKHILVYQDKNSIGNLRAWVDSCNKLVEHANKLGAEGVWHLQDDVVICKDFKERTEKYDSGIVCGFTCNYTVNYPIGYHALLEEQMWFSFPCIRIPSDVLEHFVCWANVNLWQSKYFKPCIVRNNADDMVFREWLYDNYPDVKHLNLAPNLVNHIDDLINGSVVNISRNMNTRALYWEDDEVIENLKKELANQSNI